MDGSTLDDELRFAIGDGFSIFRPEPDRIGDAIGRAVVDAICDETIERALLAEPPFAYPDLIADAIDLDTVRQLSRDADPNSGTYRDYSA